MNVSKYLLLIFTLSMVLFIGCDEKEDIQRYEQEVLTASGNPLTFTNLTSYPIIDSIMSSPPTGDFDTPYRYRLLNVTSAAENNFVRSSFGINVNSGAIFYKNFRQVGKIPKPYTYDKWVTTIGPPEMGITPGVYVVDVGVTNTNGMAIHEGAYQLTILDVPVQVDIDAPQVDAGIFEQGVLATVSYTDTSASGSDVTSVSYALVEPPVGFTINASTGAISKVNGAVSGANPLTVKVATNAGIVVAQNLVTVVVGPPPTIQMVQQDGATALSKAVVSPFTAYTTAAPVVDGMSPTAWEIIFPKSLVNNSPDLDAGETAIDFSSSFSVDDSSGKVSIAADAGLPAGMHTLSLKATNATSSEFTFEDVLNIEVVSRWETTPLYENDLSTLDQITLHHIDSPEAYLAATGSHGKTGTPALKFQTVNGANNDNRKDAAIELKIPVEDPTFKKVRFTFYEAFGYNNNFNQRHSRELYSFQAADDSAPSITPGSWDLMMDATNSLWSGTNRWGTISADISTFKKIDNQVVDIVSGTQNLYFFLRCHRIDDTHPTQGQWLLRNFLVEVSKAFTAEEY
jgi:hypothetical protein